MPALQMALLGPMQVRFAGHLVARFPTIKVQALLAYLAVEAQSAHPRDALVGLFWPDYAPESARQNLRQTLFRLRQVIPADCLLITNQTVQFNPVSDYSLDVTTFTELITACRRHDHADLVQCRECSHRLQQAVELYRGDFLAGFFLDDSPAFEEWLLLKREWLRREDLQALAHLAEYHERQGVYAQAQVYAWRQVELDPAREEAHQQLMRVLALSGRRSEALAQYESCRRLLAEELGVEPSAETVTLVEQIRAGKLGRRPGLQLTMADQPVLPSPVLVSTPAAAPAAPPTSEATIRLVTVLCVGVSEAEDLHPEAAAQAAKQLVHLSAPILTRYAARFEQGAGAGLVAIFGAEHTHEDDPERAVRAAFTIRQAAEAARLVVSAGISTGNILLASSGTSVSPNTFAGSAITLAVRMQAQAAPGQVLVGESTYRQTHAAIQFTPLTLALPGRSYTRTVYQAEHPQAQPQKSRGLAPLHADLVGRNKELAELKHALATVQAGVGHLVLLSGEAGIGKSRLITELKQHFGFWHSDFGLDAGESQSKIQNHHSKILWLEGRCLEMTMAASYWPFLDILHTYLGWPPEEDERSRAGRIVAVLDTLVAAGHLTPAQREEMGPLLGNLLSVRFGHDWDERLKFAGPEQIRHQTLVTLRDFFVALAHQQPLVLVLEDLHWADSLSLDLLTLLMEVLSEQPLLLLCVYRPEPQHRCWQLATLATAKCPDSLTEVRLRELTARQSHHLVEALLTIENLSPKVKATILEKAQGNPLFMEEVIRSLIDAGIVYQQGEVWRAKDEIEHVVVPESVQSVILSRVDRLSEALKGVLQRAAVIGRLFSRRLLAQLIPQGIELDNAITTLANQAFIYQERVVPEEEYSFKHVLVQEAIYQTTLRERRAQFHRQVAEAMEQLYADNLAERYEQLAYHYDRSGVVEKAIEYLLKAGEKARRAYLNNEAIDTFNRALDRLGKQEKEATPEAAARWQAWELEALRGLGQIYQGMGHLSKAEDYLRQAIDLGQATGLSAQELVRLYYWLGEALDWQGRFDELRQTGEAGLALLGDTGESVEAALMNTLIGLGYEHTGNVEREPEFTFRNVQFIQRLPYSEELRISYARIVHTYQFLKHIEEAMRWAEVWKQRAEQHHDLRALGHAEARIGYLHIACGRFREGISHIVRGLELAARIGDTKQECLFAQNLAGCFLELGDLQRAQESALRARTIAAAFRSIQFIISSYIYGITLLCEGDWHAALPIFQHSVQTAQERGLLVEEVFTLCGLGRAFLAQGNRSDVAQHLQEIFVRLTKLKAQYSSAPPWYYTWLCISSLSILEEAYQNSETFRRFCQRARDENPKLAGDTFVQWWLEPTQVDGRFQMADFGLGVDDFKTLNSAIENRGWVWLDPLGDCSFAVQDGFVLRAVNGRNLEESNLSTPRLLRSVEGNFAAQTVCVSAFADHPALGGLLLWKDDQNYLRLERGTLGKHEITFLGCLDNNDVIIGRGRLPAERVFLRLERIGARVNALCSADGEAWFTVGQVVFHVDDPLQVGLHAIGMIDRLIYPGAYPDGTAIRFESFTVYRCA
jgi:DNA-binding SARP family transcriptional activator